MRYKVHQGEQTVWDIQHQHVTFFVIGVWVQGGGTFEEAWKVAETAIDELLAFGRVQIETGGQLYEIESA